VKANHKMKTNKYQELYYQLSAKKNFQFFIQ